MSITVLEAMKLDTFRSFKLVAGHRGLENKIEKVGILDYEYDIKKEGRLCKGQFQPESFVITSLLFAKDNADLILEAVKCLIADEVRGLAIKNIYFNDLPQEVIDYANENAFPIFIFERSSAFFEDIVTDITDRIRFVDDYEKLETKIDILVNNRISKATVRELALEINGFFEECFFVVYCRERKYIGDSRLISILDRIRNNRNIGRSCSFVKYKGGILGICTYDKLDENTMKNTVNDMFDYIGIRNSDYFIGVGGLHTSLDEMDKGINESIFAMKASEVSEGCPAFYREIGIYRILLPYANEAYVRSFCDEIVLPLKAYDEKYNTELFRTAIVYIEKDGLIKATADALSLHENTIRYRICRLKEILGMEKLEGSFYEQLSTAVKLYKLYKNDYS